MPRPSPQSVSRPAASARQAGPCAHAGPAGPLAPYAARRRFDTTPEPQASAAGRPQPGRRFVVQQHAARRLHWDFRLQHGDVLWSWAVPRGPSMEPGQKRLAVRTEDHPLAYADFEGTIPEGNYGAGTVARWDHGTWAPVGNPVAALAAGELKFDLAGERLRGRFVLVRMKPRAGERAENWLLIKERDAAPSDPPPKTRGRRSRPRAAPAMPAQARPAALPRTLRPQLATGVETPPAGQGWLHEIKFDGYRLLPIAGAGRTRLLTRSGQDWASRLPGLAAEFAGWTRAVALDGELVALRADGVSDFSGLQARLAENTEAGLVFFAFDLLHLDGFDLTHCRLDERKLLLRQALPESQRVRFSQHLQADAHEMRAQACAMGLEGIVSKRADAPYVTGRSRTWLKLKCQGREEFIVLGFTPAAGRRVGIGALHVGFHDAEGRLHYAGGVGTGFDERELARLARVLQPVVPEPPAGLLHGAEPPDRAVRWVEPRLVVEVRFAGWSGGGRLRHAVYLGERQDKEPSEVVHEAPVVEDGPAPARPAPAVAARTRAAPKRAALPAMVVARAPKSRTLELAGVRLTHPERALWPGITKEALARYWIAVAEHALPGIARRPLALVRFPSGIGGARFFQKHGMRGQPDALRAREAGGDPFFALDDVAGLVACAQISAIELHAWGAAEDDPDHPDQIVLDLDPGDDVPFTEVVRAAGEVRDALKAVGLTGFCRTTGGKGLHVIAPLRPRAAWPEVRAFSRRFAETMAKAVPDRFVTTLSKSVRRGRILIDWLRNGRGATAIASFSPRGREGATVATPLAWSEVTARLDPRRFTLASVPKRLAGPKAGAWAGFEAARVPLPQLSGRGRG